MEERIRQLETDIALIQERNAQVEANKAWEQSPVRITALMVMTYGVAVVALIGIHNDQPFLNALIPTLGFFLSTRSLSFLRSAWIKRRTKKNSS